MFFNISSQQKSIYKSKSYPVNLDLSGIIDSIATDNILKLKLNFSDGENGTYKVYKNKKVQDYLKIKVFAITNLSAFEEINNANKIDSAEEIEKIIIKYNLPNETLNAVQNHKPVNINKRTAAMAKIFDKLSMYQGMVKLDYNFDLYIPQQNLDFLSIGYYFYNDISEYIKTNSLNKNFIDQTISWDKLYIKNIIQNSIFQPNTSIKDLRKIKSILQNNNFLEKLNDYIDVDDILKKQLKNATSRNDINAFFSKIYFARTKEKNLGMIFHYDIKNIVTKNSSYVNIAKSNQELFNIFRNVIKVDNVKILRRQVLSKNNNTDSFKILYDTEKTIIQTSLNNTLSLNETSNDQANIMQIDTNLFSNSIKTVSLEDKSVFTSKPGKYQYGISLSVKDNLGFLFKYLSEQHLDESIKDLKNFSSVLENPKYYDPVEVSVTPDFVQYILDNKSLMDKVQNSLNSFIGILKIFGIDKNLDSNFISSINDLFNLKYLDLQQITYFISIFQKIQNQIVKLTKNNNDNSFILEHWFDDIYDTEAPIDVGFMFFNSQTINGLSLISSDEFINKIKNEIATYASEPSDLNDSLDPYLYSYITPETILLPNNKMVNIKDLLVADNIDIFSELSFDIKKNSIFNSDADNIKYLKTNLSETPENLIKNSIAYSGEIIANNLSVITNIIKKSTSVEKNINTNQIPEKDTNVDTSTLLLQILSHYNLSSKQFTKINKSIDGKLSINKISDDLPLHLKLLLQNKSKIINSEIKYLQDIKQYYKFSMMYNTIHKVEYLSYGNNLNDEIWNVVDNTIFQKFAGNTNIICRLRSYTNENLKIKGLNEFKIPIYDEYFLLNINNIDTQIDFEVPVVVVVNDFAQQAAELAAKQAAEEAARLAAEQAAAEEAARIAAEQALAQQMAKIAEQQAAADLAARLAAEKAAKEAADRQRIAAERAADEAKLAAQKAAEEERARRIAEDRAAEEKIARERAAQEAADKQRKAELKAKENLERALAEFSAQQAAELAMRQAAELAAKQAAELAMKQAAKKAADEAAKQLAAQQAAQQAAIQAAQKVALEAAQRPAKQKTNMPPNPPRRR